MDGQDGVEPVVGALEHGTQLQAGDRLLEVGGLGLQFGGQVLIRFCRQKIEEVVGVREPGGNGLERRHDGADLVGFLDHPAGTLRVFPK